MKRSYYIVPVILLALFAGLYWQHRGEMDKKMAAQKVAAARILAEETAKKRLAEQKAKEDADKRQAARDAEERKKEDEKSATRKAEVDKIKDETKTYNARLAEFNKETAQLEKELATLRQEREKLIRESFDYSKKVELALIDKRNAELQVQRMADMVAKRANESTLAKSPTPPPAAPAKS